jgi:hypothetical protein
VIGSQRVVVFVDGANLYAGAKWGLHLQNSVDVDKLVKKLAEGRPLVRAYYYTTPSPFPNSPKGKAHQKFLDN